MELEPASDRCNQSGTEEPLVTPMPTCVENVESAAKVLTPEKELAASSRGMFVERRASASVPVFTAEASWVWPVRESEALSMPSMRSALRLETLKVLSTEKGALTPVV